MSTRLVSEKLEWWRRKLATFQSSGSTVATFCRQQGITPGKFYYWQRRLRQVERTADSFPVNDSGVDPESCSKSVDIFVGDQIRVRLPAADAELLSSVLHCIQKQTSGPSAFQHVTFNTAMANR